MLLDVAETIGAVALRARGVAHRRLPSALGRVSAFDAPGRGSLPPVVLLHGLGSSALPFAPVLWRLVPHVRRVVAPDMPGHGFSDAPRGPFDLDRLFEAMVAVLDHLIDEPAVLCGNSLGGALALRYARARPERVRALVLLSPAGGRMTPAELDELRRAFHMPTVADARAFIARVYHRVPPLAPLFARAIRARMRRPWIRALLASADVEHAASPEDLRALGMPLLLVWGRSERLLPPSCLAYLREHLPAHARIEQPEGIGHCPHFDDPSLVARRIVEVARALDR